MDQLNAHYTFKVSLEIRKLTMNSISVLSLGIPSNEHYLLGFPSSFNPSLHHLEAIHPWAILGTFKLCIYIYILGTCNKNIKHHF